MLEYADIIWNNIPEYLGDKLERIQIEAARIVTGATKLCSKQNLYYDTGWETLSERRKTQLRTISTLSFQINTGILLYGGELLSDEENILMNRQTLTFILESKRFN